MKMTLVLVLATLSLASKAAEVSQCSEFGIGLGDIVQPATENARSFYNNQVAVYNVDYLEPAACSAGLAIIIPDNDAELAGLNKCFLVHCFGKIDVTTAKSSYDPHSGLKLTMTPGYYDPGTGELSSGDPVSVNINLESGSVTLD